MGIPALTIGAGEQDIHTESEHIAIDDMNKSTQLIVQIINQADGYIVNQDGSLAARPGIGLTAATHGHDRYGVPLE